jgi:UDP-N-acetylglucosamine 2-epimerase (non-hydrolysing)
MAPIRESKILSKLKLEKKKYFLVSAHRQENIDNPSRLKDLVESINLIASNYGLPVICSIHPRMKSRIDQGHYVFGSLVQLHSPFGFFDYNQLQINSRIVLSDSGSIAEESAILNFKAITIRDSIERPEALEAGTILLAGIEPEGVLRAIDFMESTSSTRPSPFEYSIENTSDRVASFIASTLERHEFWSGLRKRN